MNFLRQSLGISYDFNNSKSMLKLILLMMLAVCVVAKKERCPKVKSLNCVSDQNRRDCTTRTYIKLKNGKKCPGCKVCIRPDPYRPPFMCPLFACPMLMLPASCRAKFYAQRFKIESGKTCRACDTYVCRG